jgi:hypothetical protein
MDLGDAEGHACAAQRDILSRAPSDFQRLGHLAQRAIVWEEHSARNRRSVFRVHNGCIRCRIGSACQGDGIIEVLSPPGEAQIESGKATVCQRCGQR